MEIPHGVTFHGIVATGGNEGKPNGRSPTGRAVRLVLLGEARMAHETILSVRAPVIIQKSGSSRPSEVQVVGLASGSHPSVRATVEVCLAPGDYQVGSPALVDAFSLRVPEAGLPQMICNHRRRRPSTYEARYVSSRRGEEWLTEQVIHLQTCCRRILFDPVDDLFCLNVDQVLVGNLKLEVDGVRSVVRAGEYFVINPRTTRVTLEPEGRSGVRFRHLVVAQPLLRLVREEMGLSRRFGALDFIEIPRRPSPGVAAALALWQNVPGEWGEHPFMMAAIRVLLMALWAEHPNKLVERLTRKEEQSDVQDRFRDAIQYVKEQYHRPLQLKEVARRFHMSVSWWRAECDRVFGMSPKIFLKKLRMERAMILLRQPQATVEGVARAVGYRDVRAFYRAFQDYAAFTPGAYRHRS